jgi:hypothetical protein
MIPCQGQDYKTLDRAWIPLREKAIRLAAAALIRAAFDDLNPSH